MSLRAGSLARAVACLLLVAVGFTVVACASDQVATFVSYESKLGAQSTLDPDREMSDVFEDAGQLTGRARIRLDDGTTVMADCPVEGLWAGRDRVRVRQNSDGSWVVLGKQ